MNSSSATSREEAGELIDQAFVAGVSSRRVKGMIQTLGIQGLSKWQVMARSLGGMADEWRNGPLDSGLGRTESPDLLNAMSNPSRPPESPKVLFVFTAD